MAEFPLLRAGIPTPRGRSRLRNPALAAGSEGENRPERILHAVMVVLSESPQLAANGSALDRGDDSLGERWTFESGHLPVLYLTVPEVLAVVNLRRQSHNY